MEHYQRVVDRVCRTPGEWAYRKCVRCASLTVSPIPDPATLARAYASYHTHSDGEAPRSTWYPSRASGAYWAARRERGTPSPLTRPAGRCLDIGCGSGASLVRLSQQGWDCVGTETDSEAAARARAQSGAIVFETTIAGLPSDVAGFDLILMNHVVEHLTTPSADLANLAARLNTGGVIQIATPNAGSSSASLFKQRWRGLEAPRHICVLTKAGLVSLGESAGLIVQECSASSLMDGSLFVGSMLAGPPPSSPLRLAARRALNWTTQNVSERVVGAGRGGELVAVFRKP